MALNELTNTTPYLDDYDASKNYVGIAAVPGRVIQAREFTQAQTILRDHLKRIGDAAISNGTILSGCSLLISGTTVTIDAGRIYLNGMVRYTNTAQLTINGTGTEYIGVKVNQSIITEDNDASLKDQVTGYENAGKAGAHRIKETVQFVKLDELSSSTEIAILYTLVDGDIKREQTATPTTVTVANETTGITYETLARRTYDENGSYKVEGLTLIDKLENTAEGIRISVAKGKAYINGYEVSKNAATTQTIRYATDVGTVKSEPITFKSGTLEYLLRYQPAKRLVRVTSLVQTTINVERGDVTGGTDELTPKPVDTILSVVAGTKTYVKGTDYSQSGNYVDWGGAGEEPASGTTYKVTYTYWKNMVIGTDVELTEGWDEDLNMYATRISFINPSVYPYPAVNDDNELITNTLVDYEVYYARKDLVTLDQDGEFRIYEGIPDLEYRTETPTNQDKTQLIVGTVLIRPGYHAQNVDSHLKRIIVSDYESTRLSQANLHMMKRRIDDLEYNTAMSDLDDEAIEGQPATMLKGVFTDGFIGLTKADTTHDLFNCSIDIDNEELTLPLNVNIMRATPNESASTNISKLGTVYMAPYVSKVVLNQPYATEEFLVNPYAVYTALALVTLKPKVENWSENVLVTDKVTKLPTQVLGTLRRWWYHLGASWVEEEKQKWLQLTGSVQGAALGKKQWETTKTSFVVSSTQAAAYMRRSTITVTGSNFVPNSDNIVCEFNDTIVPLTPTGTTKAGTSAGTVKANAAGKFTAKFTIPENVPCGTVNVVLKNTANEGVATYTNNGTFNFGTMTTQKLVVKVKDPLSQSFQFDKDTILTKAGLYFATKDADKAVVVQIRNMVNGYPGPVVYDEVLLDPSDIKTSGTAALETTVEFTQPVYCYADTPYCMCILSDSNEYKMWIATLGEKDVISKAYVLAQPYEAGVMFSSSNQTTWTAHQASDLKFKLYAAEYTGAKGEIIFNDITTTELNCLLVAADSVDYKNNGVTWYFRTNSTDEWTPITAYTDRDLESIATSIQLKVEVNATRNTSPIISGDTVNLIGFIEQTTGCYVSRTVTLDDTYNTAICSFNAYNPPATDIKVYYSTGSGGWHEFTNPTTTLVDADSEIYRYEYKASIGSDVHKYKVRIDLSTNNVMIRPKVRKLMNIMRTE